MCCQSAKKTAKLVADIARGAAYLATGKNEDLMQRRLKICSNCPHFRGGLVCNLCGCPMHSKARLPEYQCEDEKNRRWLAEPNYKVA